MCTFLCMSLQFAVEPQQVMEQRACRQLSVVKTWLTIGTPTMPFTNIILPTLFVC